MYSQHRRAAGRLQAFHPGRSLQIRRWLELKESSKPCSRTWHERAAGNEASSENSSGSNRYSKKTDGTVATTTNDGGTCSKISVNNSAPLLNLLWKRMARIRVQLPGSVVRKLSSCAVCDCQNQYNTKQCSCYLTVRASRFVQTCGAEHYQISKTICKNISVQPTSSCG